MLVVGKDSFQLKLLKFLMLMIISGNVTIAQEDQKLVRDYTPSALLGHGELGIKSFTNLYTQTRFFDANGFKVDLMQRETFLTISNQFTYGVSGRFNLGIEVWLGSVRIDSESSSPLGVLSFDDSMQRTALTYLGPRINWQPLPDIPRLSVISTFLFPGGKNLQGAPVGTGMDTLFLAFDNYLWINQFLFDKDIARDLQIFLELSVWVYLKRNSEPGATSFVRTPAKGILNYFLTKRITTYATTELMPQLGSDIIDAYYWQIGIGGKYEILPGNLEMELLITKFLAGKLQGAGTTYNMGIRAVLGR